MKSVLIFTLIVLIIEVLAKDDNPNNNGLGRYWSPTVEYDVSTSKYVERNEEVTDVTEENSKYYDPSKNMKKLYVEKNEEVTDVTEENSKYYDPSKTIKKFFKHTWTHLWDDYDYWSPIFINKIKKVKEDIEDKTENDGDEEEVNYINSNWDDYIEEKIMKKKQFEKISVVPGDTQNNKGFDVNIKPSELSQISSKKGETTDDLGDTKATKKIIEVFYKEKPYGKIDDMEPLRNLQVAVINAKETKEQCYIKAFIKFGKCYDEKKSIVTCMLDSMTDFAPCLAMKNMF